MKRLCVVSVAIGILKPLFNAVGCGPSSKPTGEARPFHYEEGRVSWEVLRQ